jgi:AAA domain
MVSGDPSQPEPRVRWTADELLAAQFPPTRWVIPQYFPEGLVFIAGRPKLGKSWLALQLVHAVASGGRVFDQEVIKAPALYLAFEDSARRLQKRMKDQRWPAHTKAVFHTAWEPLDQGGLALLQQAMVGEGYRLVIIDTLSRALSAKPDQNRVGDMTMVLGSLQRLALDQGAMIGVIDHHMKPRGTHPDPVDDILGSTGKGAVADVVAGLYRDRNKRGATLRIVGRDLDADKKLALEWDTGLAQWKYLGDADQVAKDTVQAKILTAIGLQGGSATTTAIAEHLDMEKSNISRELGELVKSGKLVLGKKEGKEQPYEFPPIPGQGARNS